MFGRRLFGSQWIRGMGMAAVAVVGGAPDGAPTILVVEDEVLVRLATARYLRDNGFTWLRP